MKSIKLKHKQAKLKNGFIDEKNIKTTDLFLSDSKKSQTTLIKKHLFDKLLLPIVCEPETLESKEDRFLEIWFKSNKNEIYRDLTIYGAILFHWLGIKHATSFKKIAVNLEDKFQNEYPGAAPHNKVSQFIYTASEGISYSQNHSQTFHIDAPVIEYLKIFKSQKTASSLAVAILFYFLTFIKKFFDIFWKYSNTFAWKAGDILLIHNYSVSHRRRAFSYERSILMTWS
ncbi:MAG: hypothetical protein CK427_16415 [Leptospira sp.]|nr:MAG: hypothetical protein CK427_16415 [Leptospira sp.]